MFGDLIGLALSLGAEDVAGWSTLERRVIRAAKPCSKIAIAKARANIGAGKDAIGDEYLSRRSSEQRRVAGATYTPASIVDAMVKWAARQGQFERIVDPGVGSGRFAVAAGRRFATARIVGLDVDPVAAVLARGHLAAAGLAERAEVRVVDYCAASLAPIEGRTLFLGNPPYVRHHGLTPAQKRRYGEAAARLGIRASKLAGLHLHFFAATAELASPGDAGAFVTAAEWLDVNYGAALRELLLGALGGRRIDRIDARAQPFPDATTTAAITCFTPGAPPTSMALRLVDRAAKLGTLSGGTRVARARLAEAPRWTPLFRRGARARGGVELGELCRVHRGQVTGANRVWIAGDRATSLPDRFLFPAVTRARELFDADDALTEGEHLRRVVDLPVDLGELSDDDRRAVKRFLRWARARGAADSYVARHRKAWWSVGLREPAPILASYMARRPPVFVRNLAGVCHINIAHGLYPREPMSSSDLDALARRLNAAASAADGRTYAGGLTKFEPKEMERIRVPGAI